MRERKHCGAIDAAIATTLLAVLGGSIASLPAAPRSPRQASPATGRLIEEASIGPPREEEPYLLGTVDGVGLIGERIFVLDRQVQRLRVYDLDGEHLYDIGREGQGPGEFTLRHGGLAVDPGGRAIVADGVQRRFSIFDVEGTLLDTWPIPGPPHDVPSGPRWLVATLDGTLYTRARDEIGVTMAAVRGGGETGSAVRVPSQPAGFPPERLQYQVTEALPGYSPGALIGRAVPFTPRAVFAMTPTREVVHGTSDQYRFEVRRPDGSATVVRREWEPTEVFPDEAEWHRQSILLFFRDVDPRWEWDGPSIPGTKPAFEDLLPDHSGRVWVLRLGQGRIDAECREIAEPPFDGPCWISRRFFDVFALDGAYLGSVDVPEGVGFSPPPFIQGDTFLAQGHDPLGIPWVKRFRIELQGR